MSFGISPENARYLLSALAQSQAAVFAILVSLTFITVQLSDRNITSLIIEDIKRDKNLLVIGLGSLFSVVADIAIIAFIGKPYWELMVVAACIFGFICLLFGTPRFVAIVMDYLKDQGRVEVLKRRIPTAFTGPVPKEEHLNALWKSVKEAAEINNLNFVRRFLEMLEEVAVDISFSGNDLESNLFKQLKEIGKSFKEHKNTKGIDLLTDFAARLSLKTGRIKGDFIEALLEFVRFLCTLYIEIDRIDQFSPVNDLFSSIERIAEKAAIKAKLHITERALCKIEEILDFSVKYKKSKKLKKNPYFSDIVNSLKETITSSRTNSEAEFHLLKLIRRIEDKLVSGVRAL